MSNLPPDTSHDTEQGPITLGQPANGKAAISVGAPKSPQRESNQSTLTNGVISDLDKPPGQHSNSTANGEDVQMQNSENTSGAAETQSSFQGESAQARPFHMYTGAPASLPQRVVSEGLSQHGAITPMAEGSNAEMYENLASSTSSEKRQTGSTGDTQRPQSNGVAPSTGPQESQGAVATEATSGAGLEISMIMGEVPSHSQMPSTQGTDDPSPPPRRPTLMPGAEQARGSPTSPRSIPDSSQSQAVSQGQRPPPQQQSQTQSQMPPPTTQSSSQATHPPHSQTAPAVPKFFANILNDAPPEPELKPDEEGAAALVRDLASATAALTVEQLEQVYSALMNAVWRTRGSWDRREAVRECGAVAYEILRELEEMQGLPEAGSEGMRGWVEG
jgi:hypothetical protein